MACQTSAWTEAARTRTSTSSSLTVGLSISRSSRTSAEPYLSWTIAFIVAPRERASTYGVANQGRGSSGRPLQPPPRRAACRLPDHEYQPLEDEPDRPGDVRAGDDRAHELPALLLEATDELQRTDDEEESDDDPRPGEPRLERGGLEHRHSDEDRPGACKEVAKAFPDPDPEVAMERLERYRGRFARRLGRSRISVRAR